MATDRKTTARHNNIPTPLHELESESKLLLHTIQNYYRDSCSIQTIGEHLKTIQVSLGTTNLLSMADFLNTPVLDIRVKHKMLLLLEAAKDSDAKLADILLGYGADVNTAVLNSIQRLK